MRTWKSVISARVIRSQRRFIHRFASLDTQVREIPYCVKQDYLDDDHKAPKTVFRMSLFHLFDDSFSIHYIETLSKCCHIDPAIMRFHHYQWVTLPGRTSLSDLTADEVGFLDREFALDRSILKYIA